MKIRFFNTYEPVTSFYRDLLPFLVERGMEVEVLMSADEYRLARGSLNDYFSDGSIRIRHMPIGTQRLKGSLRKIRTITSFIVGSALATLLSKPADLNFFLTQPPFFSLWGYVLKIVRGEPYCCLIMDIYPDVAVESGILRRRGFFASLLFKISRFALGKADCVVVIGRCMKKHLGQSVRTKRPTEVVPNWTNTSLVSPIEHAANYLRHNLQLENKFVVLYSGNLGVSHYFDDILEVARRLKTNERVHFVFVGSGFRLQEIKYAQRIDSLNNILTLPFQPDENLAYSLNLGDVHFISLRSGFEGIVVPSKAYGAMAVGRPIIYQGHPSGEIARVIKEEKIGYVVPLHCPDELEKTLIHYLQNPELTKEQGRRARRLAEGRLSKERALQKYHEIIRSCIAA